MGPFELRGGEAPLTRRPDQQPRNQGGQNRRCDQRGDHSSSMASRAAVLLIAAVPTASSRTPALTEAASARVRFWIGPVS